MYSIRKPSRSLPTSFYPGTLQAHPFGCAFFRLCPAFFRRSSCRKTGCVFCSVRTPYSPPFGQTRLLRSLRTVALGGGWQCKPHDESLARFFCQGLRLLGPGQSPSSGTEPCLFSAQFLQKNRLRFLLGSHALFASIRANSTASQSSDSCPRWRLAVQTSRRKPRKVFLSGTASHKAGERVQDKQERRKYKNCMKNVGLGK